MSEGWEDILESIGVEAALKLALAFGGRRLPIPRTATKASRILPVIGPQPTERLVADFGGLTLVLPIGHARRAAAHRLRAQGLSIDAIAGQLWMSRSGVKSLLRRPWPNPPSAAPTKDR